MSWKPVDEHTQIHTETGYKVIRCIDYGKVLFKCYNEKGFYKGKTAVKQEIPQILKRKPVDQQGVEEWLNDYDKRDQELQASWWQ